MLASALKHLGMLVLMLAAVVVPARYDSQPPSNRLNVVLIVIDDLNTHLGCYGNSIVKSRNIDRLAGSGVRFDRAYCQYPLCNPSRTSLLSGRRPEATRIIDNSTPPREKVKDMEFMPEYFHRYGYVTARAGKILHGKFQQAASWDFVVPDVERTEDDDGEQSFDRTDPARKVQWSATNNKDEDERDGHNARGIVKLLEQIKDGPFFVAAGFASPHRPFIAPKQYFDLYQPERIKLPEEQTQGITREQARQATVGYYACVSFVDAQVGIVLDALTRLDLTDKTIVILVSDHGLALGEHRHFAQKQNLFEEVVRVPLIIRAPGKAAGVVSQRTVELVDIFPTLTNLCGLPTPPEIQGISMEALLDNPYAPWKKAAFTTLYRPGRVGTSVRTERYRYTDWGLTRPAELYDHQTDSDEHINLINDPTRGIALAQMRQLLWEGWLGAGPPPQSTTRVMR